MQAFNRFHSAFKSVPKTRFPIQASGNRLVDANGNPFFMLGDACWSLEAQLQKPDANLYLETRKSQCYNTILFQTMEHQFSDSPPNNAYGVAPFTSAGDFSTPNNTYFQHLDWLVEAAYWKNIAVILSPMYLGFGGGSEGWYSEIVTNGTTKIQGWGSYLGNRYGAYDNIMWVMGGDFNPPQNGIDALNAFVTGLKTKDTKHLITGHFNQETSSIDVAGLNGWLTMNGVYTYNPNYINCRSDYAATALPSFVIESMYENEHSITTQGLRAEIWWSVLSGMNGYIYGNNPIWLFGTGWQSHLADTGAIHQTYCKKFLDTIAWSTLIPDTANVILTAGTGTINSTDYAVLAANSLTSASLAALYMPTNRQVTIAMSKFSGSITAQWYDPTTGGFSSIVGSPFSNTGTHNFTPTGNNASGSSDWVLLLQA